MARKPSRSAAAESTSKAKKPAAPPAKAAPAKGAPAAKAAPKNGAATAEVKPTPAVAAKPAAAKAESKPAAAKAPEAKAESKPAAAKAPEAKAAEVKAAPDKAAEAKAEPAKSVAAKPPKPASVTLAKAVLPKSKADARADLIARAAANEQGGTVLRSDPLADAQAARRVAEFVQAHSMELSRRGVNGAYGEAAIQLSIEIEESLKALPAAATAVRARSPEVAELISDAAAMAGPARDAICRVTRHPEGRRAAHAFGIGEPYSVRQPQHVLRALRRILSGASEHPTIASDAGLVVEDLRAISEMAEELAVHAGLAGAHDDHAALHEAQGAIRAYFDLVAAKGTLAFAADREELNRLLSLLPRGVERRHLRRAAEQAPAA